MLLLSYDKYRIHIILYILRIFSIHIIYSTLVRMYEFHPFSLHLQVPQAPRVMAALERRVIEVAGVFNPQEVGNMLWAASVFAIESPADASRLVQALGLSLAQLNDTPHEQGVSRAAAFTEVILGQQLHQFFLSLHLEEGLRTGCPILQYLA
jgi:hypothetical protein